MLSGFWGAAGGRAADWLAASVPALAFWAGGLALWSWYSGGHSGAAALMSWIDSRPPGTQAASMVGALLVVSGSSALIRQVSPYALRLLEGYGWAEPPRRWLAGRQERRAGALRQQWQEQIGGLAVAPPGLRPALAERVARLDARQRRYPRQGQAFMPTRVGNILRAAEGQAAERYGLDAAICWPRLWLVMPAEARSELSMARGAVDRAAGGVLWSIAFAGWGAVVPWAVPVGILIAVVTHLAWLRQRCATFADLVESAFDIYRPLLYAALRLPLPRDPADERELGRLLTEYLWRGLDTDKPRFTGPDERAL